MLSKLRREARDPERMIIVDASMRQLTDAIDVCFR